MAVFKKGDNYYIDYYFEGRRVREKVGPSWKQAQDALNARKGEIAQGKFELKRTKVSPKFEDFAKKYLEWSKGNKRSWIRDRASIKCFLEEFSDLKLNGVTPWRIEQYKLKRSQSVKKITVNREMACLKHMFTLAIKWGQASENPVKQVKFFSVNSQRLRFLSIDEERRLLAVCDPLIKPIVLTALKTGMRSGEILGLMWDQVDFENRIITVKDSKNREPRKIPMNPALTELLESIRIGSQGVYVFNNEYGRRYKTIRGPWNKALKKAGIVDFRFHDLRHTFASRLVMAGVDLVTVKELLGHKSINMTMRYSHLSQDHKRKAVELLDRHYIDTRQEAEKRVVAVSNYKQ